MKKFLCILFSILIISSSINAERPIIKDIQAIPSGNNNIIISWINPKNTDSKITSLYLYRTNFQISRYSQLNDDNIIAKLDSDISIFKDTVPDYSDYYYTILSYTEKLNTQILVSVNSTTKGVHINDKSVSKEQNDSLITNNDSLKLTEETNNYRTTPLPFLDLVEGLETDSQISDSTIEKTKSFGTSPSTGIIEIKYPYFFEEDLISSGNKDDYALFEILKTTFNKGKYSESISKLKKLSKKRINPYVVDRTIFYIGEAYYFTGDYKNAVMYFIQVEKKYPLLARKWISACLDKLEL